MIACMGGMCSRRNCCAHYHAEDRRYPVERLCVAGRDGEIVNLKPVLEVEAPEPDELSWLADVARLRAALYEINCLHPDKDSDEGFNEWGEAECFKKAQDMARAAMNPTLATPT